MRNRSLIVASMLALLTCAGPARAQQNQAIPDAPAPQPQKKPAPKAAAPPASSEDPAPAAQPPAAKDDNAFPEAVSQGAAAKANQDDAATTPKKSPAGDANPFPEDVSRDAAKAAGNDPAPPTVPKPQLPPGVSSSQSQGALQAGETATDPARASKDTEVGTFYLKTGDYQGALIRFQDASTADPTNVAAIYGLAEAQRMLGNKAEAARNYQMYLEIVPNGPRAKDSIKALKTLQAQK
jgi:tetratricopeptide (TPR) repeat protein